jgi:hypothetical protein
MTVNDELQNMTIVVAMVLSKLISRHFPGNIEKNHKKLAASFVS